VATSDSLGRLGNMKNEQTVVVSMAVTEIVETIDGKWMVKIDGWQVGGETDPMGCGNRTFPTSADAEAYAKLLEKQRAAR